ncbi:MAG: hypothetical protein ISS10_00560 [Candidatus Marinimicrobia bacterium]|nr:hypothetical protein [Candidatus Neomarinimicrobiota bacterium]MBL7059471.1 hypothetical protein [Candidatus Neomarinimicrobiota bacterium]
MKKNNEAPKFLRRLEKYMPGPNSKYNKKPADFMPGFIHGLILPLTFIYSQYNPVVKLYETDNVGRRYNVGFVIGLIGLIKAISG